jgi:hypothetical protein
MVGKATVYNTIQLLKDLGQALELEFGDAANRYDGNIPEPHPHLVCTQCGRIDEVMNPSLHDTASRVADEVGYELLSHRFDVYGLCPRANWRSTAPRDPSPEVVAGYPISNLRSTYASRARLRWWCGSLQGGAWPNRAGPHCKPPGQRVAVHDRRAREPRPKFK